MRKNFTKTFAMVGVVTTVMATNGMVAFAKEAPAQAPEAATVETVSKQIVSAELVAKVFDAEYYAKAYPDVVAVLGNDPAALMDHFIKSGIHEGRDASATFNASIYALANPDIVAVYGDSIEGYISHFVNYGINEKKSSL